MLYFSYVLGSSEKQIVSEDKEVFNLESRIEIENSLKQVILFCTFYIFEELPVNEQMLIMASVLILALSQ